MPLPIIDDHSGSDLIFPKGLGRGHDPGQVVREMFAAPSAMKLIPRSEWSARCKDIKENQSGLRSLCAPRIPNINQGPVSYCWAHSTTHAVAFTRVRDNQPYEPLSAYMVASIIKGGRDEGGWCGLSAKFMRENGVCTQKFWPQGNRSLKLDTPEARANAARHKIAEDWVDLARAVYDQNLTFDQLMTCLFLRIPVAVDFNWWGHSVCAIEPVEVEPGSFGYWIRNSWGETWSDGENGDAILRGTRAIPDGAIAINASAIAA